MEAIEFGLWWNGQPMMQQYLHLVTVGERCGFAVMLPLKTGKGAFRLTGTFHGEIAPDWWAYEALLSDEEDQPICPPRPGLLYLGPTDLPMVITFPAQYSLLRNSGIWVVSTRAGGRYDEMIRKFKKLKEAGHAHTESPENAKA